MKSMNFLYLTGSLLVLLNVCAFATDNPVIKDEESTKSIVQITIQERGPEVIKILEDEIQCYAEKYNKYIWSLAPQSPYRTAFNSLAKENSLVVDEREYRIAGDSPSDKEKFIAALPWQTAFISNNTKPLKLKSVTLIPDNNKNEIVAVYTCPPSVVSSQESEFAVKGALSPKENFQLIHLKSGQEATSKLLNRIKADPKDVFIMPDISTDENQHKINALKDAAKWKEVYDRHLHTRDMFSKMKSLMPDGERKYQAFVKQLVEFRLCIQDGVRDLCKIQKGSDQDISKYEQSFKEINYSLNGRGTNYDKVLPMFLMWSMGGQVDNPNSTSKGSTWGEEFQKWVDLCPKNGQ